LKTLFFDTETSGLPNMKETYKHPDQPWIVQLALILADETKLYHRMSFLVHSEGREIHPKAQAVHGISTDDCEVGLREILAAKLFEQIACDAEQLVCHNVKFDRLLILSMLHRQGLDLFCEWLLALPSYCTMECSTEYCKLPPHRWGSYKWPKLTELHKILFDHDFSGAHDALADVEATRRCYLKMKEMGL
jgi:DNA polymerase-3 subunit epsilon